MKTASTAAKEIKSARAFAVKILDDYSFGLEVITQVLRISPKTVQRLRLREVNRPSSATQHDEVGHARSIVAIRTYRADYSVSTIAAILKISPSAFYRFLNGVERTLSNYSREQQHRIAVRYGGSLPVVIENSYALRRIGSGDPFHIIDSHGPPLSMVATEFSFE